MRIEPIIVDRTDITNLTDYDFGKILRKLRKNTLIEPLPDGDYWIVSIPRLAYKRNKFGIASYEIVDMYDPNTDPKYRGNKKNILKEDE